MATLGFGDLKNLALPALWDTGAMEKVRLQDGRSFAQLITDINAGMGQLNASLLSMPHYSGLFAIDDEMTLEYGSGDSNAFYQATEYTAADPFRGVTTGHMLPLKPWDRTLGWTMDYLRKARSAKLDADIRSAVTDGNDLWQKRILRRLFLSTGETVGSTSNASVPLVDAQATDTNYIPPKSGQGNTFTSTHTHLLRHAAITDDTLAETIDTLQEHGHTAPFDVVAAEADIGTWVGLTGWKPPLWRGIVWQSTVNERADISDVMMYQGYVETRYGVVRVWMSPRVPTAYYAAYKTYGANDPRNPCRIRIDTSLGFGFILVPGMYVLSPVTLAAVRAEFGVGIGPDRTNGVLVYIASSGSYTSPTIT